MTAPTPAPTQGTPDPFGQHAPPVYATAPAAPPLPPGPPPPVYATQAPPPEPPQQAATAALQRQAQDRATVAARGVDITLRDGRVLDVRYGMAGIVQLEDEFGSLQGVSQAFAMLSTGDGAVFTAILKLLGAGLVHHGIDKAELMRRDLLLIDRLMAYGDAAAEAFERAFPAPPASAGEAAGQTTS